MSEAVAGVRGVSKTYEAVTALSDVTLEFEPGVVHALIGENGSGKSTFVKILSGALQPDYGTVVVDGNPINLSSPHDALVQGIGTIYQDSAIVPELSAAANVMLGHEPKARFGILRSSLVAQAQEWLASIDADVDPNMRVSQLTASGRQLVAIAKALSTNARLLILDEPTAALGQQECDSLLERIASLRARGLAVLYISHRLAEVRQIADELSVLKDGTLVRTGPNNLSETEMAELMVGRKVSSFFPQRPQVGTDILLEARDIISGDGKVHVPELTARSGEIVGLAGLAGSGRSTIAQILGGVQEPTKGEVLLKGKPLAKFNVSCALAQGLSYVPPDRRAQGIVPEFSVRNSVSQSALRRFTRLGVLNLTRERATADAAATDFGVKAAAPTVGITTLSGGNQQKVILARSLCADANVLVCEEPTAGVDVGARAEIYEHLAQHASSGAAIVLASEDMLELIGMCHRIVVVREGSISAIFDASEATESRLIEAQLPVSSSKVG